MKTEIALSRIWNCGHIAFEKDDPSFHITYTFWTDDAKTLHRFIAKKFKASNTTVYDNKESGCFELKEICENSDYTECEPIYDYRDLF